MSEIRIPNHTFPPTAWTAVLSARNPGAPTPWEARETLCRVSSEPVASYSEALGADSRA